jgi:hypothetical protein
VLVRIDNDVTMTSTRQQPSRASDDGDARLGPPRSRLATRDS